MENKHNSDLEHFCAGTSSYALTDINTGSDISVLSLDWFMKSVMQTYLLSSCADCFASEHSFITSNYYTVFAVMH